MDIASIPLNEVILLSACIVAVSSHNCLIGMACWIAAAVCFSGVIF